MTMLEITLNRGMVGKKGSQRKVVEALGLGKFGSSVKRAKSPTICGMIEKVSHLVTVTECGADSEASKASAKASGEKPKQRVKKG